MILLNVRKASVLSIIKSFSVNNGDTFYIKHGTNNFTIIDCNLIDERKEEIVDEIIKQSSDKEITRFISTHPDEDHIHGLPYLDSRLPILNFYCVRNQATEPDETESFLKYCELRDSGKAFYLEKGCKRCWMNEDDTVKRYGSSGINIEWPVLSNENYKAALKKAADGFSPNNISPIITYSLDRGVKAVWMGDLESGFMSSIEEDVSLSGVDVLFAPHHGRSSGRPPKSWMEKMNPGLVVIGEASSEVLDYYSGYTHICQNTAKDMVFDCVQGFVHVYAQNPCRVEGLIDKGMTSKLGLEYVGSLCTKSR